jgi:hypothetical protein
LHPQLIGVWRSWLAHMSGGHGVGSSSLLTPTKTNETTVAYAAVVFAFQTGVKSLLL